MEQHRASHIRRDFFIRTALAIRLHVLLYFCSDGKPCHAARAGFRGGSGRDREKKEDEVENNGWGEGRISLFKFRFLIPCVWWVQLAFDDRGCEGLPGVVEQEWGVREGRERVRKKRSGLDRLHAGQPNGADEPFQPRLVRLGQGGGARAL